MQRHKAGRVEPSTPGSTASIVHRGARDDADGSATGKLQEQPMEVKPAWRAAGRTTAESYAAFLSMRRRTVFLTNVVAVMERMDEQIVPALSRPLGCAFRAGPHQLGLITFARALVQAVASPLGGLAGHFFDRITVLFVGCAIWGFFCTAFSFATTVNQGIAAWAFNGVGLALIIPNSQSLIADYYTATQRGQAFGVLMLTGGAGGMLGALYVTNLGGMTRVPPLGVDGWRLAFASIGVASILVGTLTWLVAVDPTSRRTPRAATGALAIASSTVAPSAASSALASEAEPLLPRRGGGGSAVAGEAAATGALQSGGSGGQLSALGGRRGSESLAVAGCAVEAGGYESAVATASVVVVNSGGGDGAPILTWRRIWDTLTTPTFIVIVLQGIVGSTPWNALVFLTLYLQLIGFSDATASSLMALLLGGGAAGSLVGGWLGDRVAERHPHHGRVALVQFSVGVGVPLSVLLMRGLPMSATPGSAVLYGAVMLTTGLLISWAAPACNNPVFAEIVPPDMRNLVYAFDRSFEGAISALGAPLVGMAAERWFGFTGVAGGEHACDQQLGKAPASGGPVADLAKARALGDAMLLFMVVPWTLCTLFYTGLHWTYPRDRARVLRPQVIEVFGNSSNSVLLGKRRIGTGFSKV